MSTWSPSSWRDFPIKQQPSYKDPETVKRIEQELEKFPPLIFAEEARSLQDKLADVTDGRAFLLQGGDCAESFNAFNAETIKNLRVNRNPKNSSKHTISPLLRSTCFVPLHAAEWPI